MSKTEIVNIKGVELGKRTYCDGAIFKVNCPKCNSEMEHDFGEQELSYPTVGKWIEVPYMYCEECDSDFEKHFGRVKVNMSLEMEYFDE